MRKLFVKTENYKRFTSAVSAVEQRGAAEAGMLLVHGEPGFGKTQVVSRWAAEVGAAHLRANVDWTPRYFLVELHKALGIEAAGRAEEMFRSALKVITAASLPLVIDEAEFTLHNKAQVLEKVRDFSDRAEVTVVLVGMERIQSSIARHKQISGRIAQVVEFKPASLADVAQACELLSEVAIAPDLVNEVHRLSGGRMREVLNIIAAIERVAKLNGHETVGVEHVRDVPLSHDWRSRTPLVVAAKGAAARGKGR